jgi:hypothetical protein
VPVLARHIERAGIPTVVSTMMPDVAQWLLAPRVLGVQVPFGHSFGVAGDDAMHRTILSAGLALFDTADAPGARADVDVEWPVPRGEAYKSWQPAEPSPIVKLMLEGRGS